MKRSMKNLVSLVLSFMFLFGSVPGSTTELGQTRFLLKLAVSSSVGSKNIDEWIYRLPLKKQFKVNLVNWFQRHQALNQPIRLLNYDYQLAQISWQEPGQESRMVLKMISIHPLTFEWNGIISTIEYPSSDLDYLLKQLQKFENKKGASWFYLVSIPRAEAKGNGFFDNKFMIPLLILNLFSLGSAAYDIKGMWNKAEAAETRYDEEAKAIANITDRVDQARENKIYPFTVMGASCLKTVGNGTSNPLAEPGEKGYTTFGLNNILLTPKGKLFGESDIEINYSESENGKKREISEIRLRKKPNSKDSKNPFENDCLMFSSAIKKPENRFLEKCVNEAFPGKSIKNIDDFYKTLGIFNLNDYETMAATEPGCHQITSWITGGPTVITKTQLDTSTKATTANPQENTTKPSQK